MEINIGYIFRQLKKSERWLDVLRGIEDGTLDIGSRTPTSFPGWVTPEVLHGGFATGKAPAEGPLAEDEIALLQQIGADVSDAPAGRQAIARRLLSETGPLERTARIIFRARSLRSWRRTFSWRVVSGEWRVES
jgi:hypothetical protein